MTNVEESNQDPNIINTEISKSTHLKDLLRLILLGLLGVMFLSLSSIWVGHLFTVDIQKLITGNLENGNNKELTALRTILILNSILAFLLPAILYNLTSDKKFFYNFGLEKNISPLKGWSWSVAFFLMAMPMVLMIAWLNQQIPLPEWANKTEQNVSGMLKSLLGDGAISSLVLNVFIMALLPALGEEWFFRGSLQRIFMRWFYNPWKAILISSFLFSALHFQLEGFLPRFFLGVLLGYLFQKTGNIWIPVFLHFLFNGLQIVMAFFSKDEIETLNVDKMEKPGWIPVCICTILLFILYKQAPRCLTNYNNEPI